MKQILIELAEKMPPTNTKPKKVFIQSFTQKNAGFGKPVSISTQAKHGGNGLGYSMPQKFSKMPQIFSKTHKIGQRG